LKCRSTTGDRLVRKLASFTAVLFLLLTACGGEADVDGSGTEGAATTAPDQTETGETSDSTPAGEFDTVTDGVLTVGTELPAPPFWIGDDYESITGGYEVDLAREIASRFGLGDVEFVEVPFAGLVAGQQCPCDLALAQVTITDERAEVVDFTSSYFDANQGVLVNEGTEVPDLETAKSLQWGAQLNTTGAFYVEQTIQPEAELQIYNTVVDAFNALRAEQVDAVMLDTPIVLGEASQPDSGFEVVGQFETGEEYGGVLAKDSPNTPIVSGIIDELREEGFLDELGAEYFNDPASVPFIES
jgi:polar amino acid transport system substrate-binding protein